MIQEVEQAIIDAVKKAFAVDVLVHLTRPDEKFGDYATNTALQLAKQLEDTPEGGPRAIAQAIVDNLSNGVIAKAEIAGPGFINIWLTDTSLAKLAVRQPNGINRGKIVVIETNNPNPFKAIHIGHAFNAIVADTIANLLAASGATVHRVSYHGDVGLHVGKSMFSLLKYVDGNLNRLNDIKSEDRNSFMSKMYADGSAAYKQDTSAKERINELAAASFDRSDVIYGQVYDICFKWSFEAIDGIMARLGNNPIEKRYLESQADELGLQTVKANVGKVFEESDGALVFLGSKYGVFDNVFVSSTGRGLYAARDLGLMELKNNDFHPDKSYVVTAVEQKDYFKGVIKASELCLPDLNGQTTNISTGTVKLSTGKMSSRNGDVLEISWLFDQVTDAIVKQGGAVTEQIVAGALRYEFLKSRIGSDVTFNVDEAVSLQGNSGPYLQYAHARACSILAKAKPTTARNYDDNLQLGERSLLRKIGEFAEAVERSINDLMPHHMCTYLYELAQVFNHFYEHNRVLGDAREAERLQLVAMYTHTLKAGLNLLNIPAPDKM